MTKKGCQRHKPPLSCQREGFRPGKAPHFYACAGGRRPMSISPAGESELNEGSHLSRQGVEAELPENAIDNPFLNTPEHHSKSSETEDD